MQSIAASPEELQALLDINTALTAETRDSQCLEGVAGKIHQLLPFQEFLLMHERGTAVEAATWVYEFTALEQGMGCSRRTVKSLRIARYLESLQKTETFQNAFFWRRAAADPRSGGAATIGAGAVRRSLTGLPTFGTPALDVTPPPSSGVAGLARTDEPPVSEVTYIELRVEEADLPASHLFFVNIIVFYLHVYLVRGAGRLIEVEEGPELTVKEKEVLQWIASGKTSWEVGKILSVSERTVKFHLRNIYAKLGVATRAQAATKASRLGLL